MTHVSTQKTTGEVIAQRLSSLEAQGEGQARALRTIIEDLNYGATIKALSADAKAQVKAVEKIAAHPYLALTPGQFDQQIAASLDRANKPAVDKLKAISGQMASALETRHGSAAQQWRVYKAAAFGCIAGVLITAALTRGAPVSNGASLASASSTREAPASVPAPSTAKVLTTAEKWAAGQKQMQDANPDAWNNLVWKASFKDADLKALEECLNRSFAQAFGSVQCEFKTLSSGKR